MQAGRELHYLDLPVNIQLAQMLARITAEDTEAEEDEAHRDDKQAQPPAEPPQDDDLVRDPISALARTAGYEDGESWWNDLIEQNNDDDELIFTAVDSVMDTLRGAVAEWEDDHRYQRDLAREAHMRLEIGKQVKDVGARWP